MRRPSRTGLPWLFVLCANLPLAAQNLESIGREKPFSLNGGVSVNQIFYAAKGLSHRRDPSTFFASGRINLSLYGWSVPLTFGISNQNTSFSQPFNRYSLHPTWKWITVHAGYTSMSYSPYTVNGHIFSGAGIDLTPGKWRFSALYGRLLKPVEPDTSARNLPSYQRMGWAMKLSHGANGNALDIILFHAGDNSRSITAPPDSFRITPQENLVVSIGGARTLLKNFVMRGELAISAMTRDTRASKTDNEFLLSGSSALFQPRVSSSYYQAFKSSLDYQRNDWVIGIGYERIDPEYRTLGAYYFNNDLENVTLNTTGASAEGKLTMAVSAGVQHDNLDKTKISTMRRLVSSMNITFIPSPRLNISGSWSSFQTHTLIRSGFESINQLTPYENLDTLNFTQISKNGTLTGMYTLTGPDNASQNINLHVSWQQAAENGSGTSKYSGTSFYNFSAGYSINISPKNTGLAVTFNTTINEGSFINTRMLGPTVSLTRSFYGRKLRTTLSSSWNTTYSKGVNVSSIMNTRLNTTVTFRNKHNLNVTAILADRTLTEISSAKEFTATIGYNYSFGTTTSRP